MMDPGDKMPRTSTLTPGQPTHIGADRKQPELERINEQLHDHVATLENLALRINNLRDRLMGPRPEEVQPEGAGNDAGLVYILGTNLRYAKHQTKRILNALTDLEDAG